MKLALILLVSASSALAQNAALPGNQPPVVRPRAQSAIEDVVQTLFIAQFQEQVQPTDEQFVKILPLLRRGIQTLRDNANRSVRAVNVLKQLLMGNASEDELNAQIRVVDEADRLSKSNQQAFVTKIDPFLTAAQRARFRIFQSNFDQRLREVVQRARQLTAQPPQQPQQPREQ